MIRATNMTLVECEQDGDTLYIADLFGTSLDTKPATGYATGSTFTEVDTGDIYLFNEDASEWVLNISLQA